MTLPTTTTLTDALQQACDIAGVPGAAAGVRVGGQTVRAGTGVINLRTGVPVSDSTLFQIGSITKVWTATLLMTLVQDGRVALDAPVAAYVPELPALAGAGDEELTVLHLLNHTSGLPADWFPDTGRGDDCLERFVARLDGVASAHPVGRYCSLQQRGLRRARPPDREGHRHDVGRRAAPPHNRATGPDAHDDAARGSVALPHGCGSPRLGRRAGRRPDLDAAAGVRAGRPDRLLGRRSAQLRRRPRERRADRLTQHGLDRSDATPHRATARRAARHRLRHRVGSTELGRYAGARPRRRHGRAGGRAPSAARAGITVALLTNGGDWLRARDAFLAAIVPVVAGVAVPPPLQVPQDPPQFTARDYTGAYERSGVACEVVEVAGELELRTTVTDELEALASAEQIAKVLRPYDSDMFLARERAELPYAPVVFLRDEAGRVAYLHHGGRIAARVR